MKHMKKLFALMLAAMMVLAMSVTAFADEPETYEIKITQNTADTGEHTYGAYKIFEGDLANGKISNLKWATGLTVSDDAAAAIAAALGISAADAKDASKVADKLKALSDDADALKAFAAAIDGVAVLEKEKTGKGDVTIEGLTGGYYLVKDKTNPTTATGEYASQTRFIVKVTGATNPTVVTAKSSVPSIEKKLKDTNDSTAETSGWQDSADYDVDDVVPYKLTISLGEGIQNYKQYYLRIEDTMSEGLTYKNDLEVYVDYDGDFATTDDQVKIEEAAFGTPVSAEILSATGTTLNAKKYSYAIADLFAVDGVSKASITSATKIYAFYSAQLTGDAVQYGKPGNPNDVVLIYASNPNYEGEGENQPTEETPKDRNIVFTYKTDVNKYADSVAEGNELEGAEFKLYKEIKAEYDTLSVKPIDLTVADNVFSAKGLDDGKYILQETKAPDGFNLIIGDVTYNGVTYNNAVEFTVDATHDTTSDDPQLNTLTASRTAGLEGFTMVANTNLDTLSADIADKSGSILPSTGGIGTTMFYVIGAMLAAGAAVVLITRRRMAA